MTERDLVFFSYRHDDEGERWLSLILRWLEPYALSQQLVVWSDRDIRTGELWDSRVKGAIERTSVAVLLVNQTFFGSGYIKTFELPPLILAAREQRLRLIPVPIGPCDGRLLQRHGLDAFQFTHPPSEPLSARVDHLRELSLTEVAVKISEAVDRPNEPARPIDSISVPTRPRSILSSVAESSGTHVEQGLLFDVPQLDRRHFVERRDEMAALQRAVLHGAVQAVGVVAVAPGVGLHGMGGMGKTELAKAFCHDPQIRQAFPDGIAWLTLGQQPDVLALQNRLLRHFNPRVLPADNVGEAQAALRSALHERQVLIVVDDIWDLRHFQGFDVVGPRGRLLMTTRDAALLSQAGAQVHELRGLPLAAARQLLGRWSGTDAQALPSEADDVVRETGGLPLALKLAGAQATAGTRWQTLAEQLREGRLRFLDHPYGSVYESLGRSVDALSAPDRERYLELAVFAEDEAAPFVTIARLWSQAGLDDGQSERLLGRLATRALLEVQGAGPSARVSLHDLQHDFVLARCIDVPLAHARLLDAHRQVLALPASAIGWSHMPPDESYLWSKLAMHLDAAGRGMELEAALSDFDFLQARIASVTRGDPPRADVVAMLRDFSFVETGSPLHDIRRTLQRSAHVLTRRPSELSSQFYGRLGRSEQQHLSRLAEQAKYDLQGRSLVPAVAALESPGGTEFVFVGHEHSVRGVLLLPDGRRVLSWSADKTLRLWDLEHPGMHEIFAGHEGTVEGVQLLPDGGRALSWSGDGTLRLWDLEHPGEHEVFAGHEGKIHGAILLPDGRRVLSWSKDNTLRLWDLEHPGNHEIFVVHEGIAAHEKTVEGVLLLHGSGRVLSWSNKLMLRLWDLEHPGNHENFFLVHFDEIKGVLLLPDGRRVLSWSLDKTLCLWDPERPSEHEVFAGHEGTVEGVQLLPDGGRALSWSGDGTLRLWDLEHPGEHEVLAGHKDVVEGVLLLPDGRRALSWSSEGTLHLRDLERPGAQEAVAGHEGEVEGVLLLPDGRRVLSWSADKTLRLWDLEHPGMHEIFAGHEGTVEGVQLLPDGGRALSWSGDGTLRLWDLEHPGEHEVFAGHEGKIHGAILLPDGRGALSWSEDKTLRLWDLEHPGSHEIFAGHEGTVEGVQLLPDGGRAVSWSGDSISLSGDLTLRLWDLKHPGMHEVFAGHEGKIHGAILLPDGGRALSWSGDGTLRLWDLKHPGIHEIFAGHKSTVFGALLLPDGRRVLSWSLDKTLRLWDLEHPGEHEVFAGHEGIILGAQMLPDGGRVLSRSWGKTVRLWDLECPGTHKVLSGHEGNVNGVLILPDGRGALSWSNDHTARLWQLSSGTEVGVYRADAAIRSAVITADSRTVFLGDALGHIQILQVGAP